VRVAFDENTPRAVAHALRILAEADAIGSPEPMEVLHALDFVEKGDARRDVDTGGRRRDAYQGRSDHHRQGDADAPA
jgi:hypothetical protein